jgi:hypothetical protein
MSASGKVGDDLKGLAYRLERYLRLEATEHLTVVTTYVVLAAVTFALATSAIFFSKHGIGQVHHHADWQRDGQLLHRWWCFGVHHLDLLPV